MAALEVFGRCFRDRTAFVDLARDWSGVPLEGTYHWQLFSTRLAVLPPPLLGLPKPDSNWKLVLG